MSNIYDLIIIGGGPSGFSAGIYAGRAKLKTLIIEKDGLGGQIGITSEIVNYPGIENISGADFMANMKKQVINFGVEYLMDTVESVDFSGDIKKVKTKNGEYESVGIIISTGARPRTAGFKGEDEFRGRGVGYCATCDGQFFTGLDIFVVGGGFAAAEEAIFLTRYAKKVYVLVRGDSFSCSKTIADKVMANDKIEVKFNTVIKEISGGNVPNKAVLFNKETNEEWVYEAPSGKTFGTFVFAGYEPLSSLFETVITLDERKYILTDDDMKTNIDGVYAAGDIRPKKLRQLVTAVSDGAIAATNIEKYIEHKKEELGLVIEQEEKKEEAAHGESFFDEDLKNSLKPVLDKFLNKVQIKVLIDDSKLSSDLKSFLDDFKAIGEKVTVDYYKEGVNPAVEKEINAQMIPVFALYDHEDHYMGIKYHGIPSGHEFNSFVIALYNTAGPGQEISNETLNKINSIDKKVNVKVGVSLTCTMCPEVVMGTQLIAAKNKNVEAEMIDVSYFPEFKDKYNIMSVPCIIINDEEVHFGKKPVDELIGLLNK